MAKVVLAKTLVQEPSIVILDEPTRGVDVGTIPYIHAEIQWPAGSCTRCCGDCVAPGMKRM